MKLNRSFTVGIVSCVCLLIANRAAQATMLSANVAESSDYALVYEFSIPVNSPGWNSTAVTYAIDNSGSIAHPFTRVAYYMELVPVGGGDAQWVYTSFNSAGFATSANKLGVPNTASGEFYQQTLNNMNVFSNVGGIVTGNNVGPGNIEFWPSNYGPDGTPGGGGIDPPVGNSGVFDYDDGGANTGAGHGSMQIHNYTQGQTLFAYNAWGSPRTSELGLGNQVGGSGNPDWTFNTSNISLFSVRTLQILVNGQQVPEPSTFMLFALGGLGILGWIKRRRNDSSSI